MRLSSLNSTPLREFWLTCSSVVAPVPYTSSNRDFVVMDVAQGISACISQQMAFSSSSFSPNITAIPLLFLGSTAQPSFPTMTLFLLAKNCGTHQHTLHFCYQASVIVVHTQHNNRLRTLVFSFESWHPTSLSIHYHTCTSKSAPLIDAHTHHKEWATGHTSPHLFFHVTTLALGSRSPVASSCLHQFCSRLVGGPFCV